MVLYGCFVYGVYLFSCFLVACWFNVVYCCFLFISRVCGLFDCCWLCLFVITYFGGYVIDVMCLFVGLFVL